MKTRARSKGATTKTKEALKPVVDDRKAGKREAAPKDMFR
ncbi:hypothetical protein CASFOL_037891 [Castilleja foliolosa]|uniref:Uncharacterized protein n=1 Tax=Castilleja foliolosa TaxID=1961234 RepID=A0ABD3BJH4_9LAMI